MRGQEASTANGKFVYVGEIRSVLPSLRQKGGYDFNVCGEPSTITEVKRDDVQLTFAAEDDFLYRDVDSPDPACGIRSSAGSSIRPPR